MADTFDKSEIPTDFFQISAKDIDGNDFPFSQLKGKLRALLIVNVACECGLTSDNYTDLVAIQKEFAGKDFSVLAFPCNQFANQESKTEKEIKEFVSSKFGVNFPMFQKIEVNGPNTHPLYRYLKDRSEFKAKDGSFEKIPWNFSKFLLDEKGNVVKYFSPKERPANFKDQIAEMLAKK